MKKKLLPFILGLSMIAATPLVAHAVDTPEVDSENVKYGGFAEINENNTGETPVVTAIPECTMTIPRDTTIRKGALSANIGRVTIDGHYFVKPYYVEVSADKEDFTKVYETGDDIPNGKAAGDRRTTAYETGSVTTAEALANQDIIFDVATSLGTPSDSGTAAANENFVQSGIISHLDSASGDDKVSSYTASKACRRFWKQERESDAADQENPYKDGEVCDINGQEDICLRISDTQWKGETGALNAKTKPVGGKYKGSITFTATFRDNYIEDMGDWAAYPLT